MEALGVSRDATARVKAEQALRESEARFRALIERSTDMIVLLDAEGRITFWSPSAAEALGLDDRRMLAGRAVLDLVHPDDRTALRSASRRLLAERRRQRRASRCASGTGRRWRSLEGPCRNLLADPAVRGAGAATRAT